MIAIVLGNVVLYIARRRPMKLAYRKNTCSLELISEHFFTW